MSGEASPNTWVVRMQDSLRDTDPSKEKAQWMKPSIYRVPERIKRMTKSQAYRPHLVSLGPFHYGAHDLLPMEEHKSRAVRHLVKRSGKEVRLFFEAIEVVADELMDAYDNLDDNWSGNKGPKSSPGKEPGLQSSNVEPLTNQRGRDGFVQLMLTDGCFLLEVMRAHNRVKRNKSLKDYAPNDPIFSIQGFFFLSSEIISDMILMENQLPLLVLERILNVQKGTSLQNNNKEVNKLVLDFMGCQLLEDTDSLGLHPLDMFHKSFCGLRPDLGDLDEWDDTVPSAVELREARVQFKKSSTSSICDIDFNNGVLRMPLIIVHDYIEKTFLNLMAFERLYIPARNAVTDYIIFMDNIINSERDVALLRSKGLIKGGLGSDKEVAELFNTLSKGAVMSPYCKLVEVQQKMQSHCRKPWNKWRATFEHTYLSNPWVFISLVAAIILLVATVMQTIYAVVPFYKR